MLSTSATSQIATSASAAEALLAPARRSVTSVAAMQWMPALAATVLYPITIQLFIWNIHAAERAGAAARLLSGAGAVLALVGALAAPALAMLGLYSIRLGTGRARIAVRRLLHLACAVPPLYLLSIRIAGGISALVGHTASALLVWWSLWAVLGVLAWNACRKVSTVAAGEAVEATLQRPDAPRPLSALGGRARRVHLVAVVAILAAFLILHLANHIFALWSVPAQRAVMLALREWYRTIWMEPIILGLFVLAAATGLARLTRLTRTQSDGFRVLQTASGCYLAFFLVSHIWATLGARYHGIETDWAFASGGKAGMLATDLSAAVLLYYVFALLVVGIHAGLGLRMALLSRRAAAATADRAARAVMALGAALTVAVVAALLGLRLGA